MWLLKVTRIKLPEYTACRAGPSQEEARCASFDGPFNVGIQFQYQHI
jgi:hypothetical protein